MNDDLTDFENELAGLRPAGVSQRLEQRLASRLAPDAPADRALWWQRLGFSRPSAALGWGLLAPALTAVVVLALSPAATSRNSAGHAPTVAQVPAHVAVRASNVLYQTQDDGVVLDGTREPVRRVRYHSADLVQWHNLDTGARCEVSYPREDVALVPVHAE